MRAIRNCISLVCLVGMLTIHNDVSAQCAMCTLNAENSVKNGNTQGKGLNDGILYLLAAPYLAVAGIGLLWYKKYRKKNDNLNVRNERINLN